MIRTTGVLFVLAVALSAAAAEDLPYLVRDLPGVTVSDSMGFGPPSWTTVEDTTWFVAFTGPQTLDIFKTDGTAAGTVRVTNGNGRPHPERYGPFLGRTGDKLIFGGVDDGGEGVFSLDVHGGAPVLLGRVDAGSLTNGALFGDLLYFSAEKSDTGEHELWRTDGTILGTHPVDLLPGARGTFDPARETRVFVAGDALFFFGETPHGMGLHRTRGTADSTTLLLPLSSSALYNDTNEVHVFGERLLFYLQAGDGRPRALWASDGTPSGTTIIAEADGFSPFATLNEKLFFTDGRKAIWTTDGTEAGTERTDIFAGRTDIAFVYGGRATGSKVFLYANHFGRATLYATQGTAATTQAVTDVDHSYTVSNGEGFVMGDKYYFRNNDGIHGMELWVTDGTTPQLLADVNPGYRSGIESGAFADVRPDGRAIFIGTRFETGREPWITDGTAAGTRLVANVAPEDPVHGSSPRSLRASGERVFFVATLTGGDAIGVSDGSSSGTSARLLDFPWTIHGTAAANGRYFFSPSTADPFGLYATDGTAAGTTGLHAKTTTPHAFRDGVLFQGDIGAVWFSDGTLAGTRMIGDAGAYAWLRIFPTEDLAWFSDRSRIWKTDGTSAGTVEIVPTEAIRGEILDVAAAGVTYFFLESSSSSTQARLWRSDGTAAGTRVVKALGPNAGIPTFAGAKGDRAYFRQNANLHRTDGTEAGTFALPAPPPCATAVFLGETLVFPTYTFDRALTLWRSDGTVEGTTKLMTIRNANGCVPLVARGNVVYFAGWDAAHGWEPWVTDGTLSGTKMLADVWPGATGSDPAELTLAGDRVFFSAKSPNTGRELWAIGDPPAVRRRGVRH